MAVEIELKVWVDDRSRLEAELERRYGHGDAYHKLDRYYRLECNERAVEFRVRRDGNRAVCTHKVKRIHDGVETNQEDEFELADAQAFERFVQRLGAHEFIRKEKIGLRYRSGELLLELSEVLGLGHFLEIEALAPADVMDAPGRHAQFVNKLHAVLDELKLPRSRIEPTPYTVLLGERANRPTVEKM